MGGLPDFTTGRGEVVKGTPFIFSVLTFFPVTRLTNFLTICIRTLPTINELSSSDRISSLGFPLSKGANFDLFLVDVTVDVRGKGRFDYRPQVFVRSFQDLSASFSLN